ncbi:MAG: N5-carboxyaminoimidazole ribonucleotide mutase, partial [uncultured Rubrobacteraceae bacterium]
GRERTAGTSGGRGDGQRLGLGDDAPRGRDPGALRGGARAPGGLGPPHAGPDGLLREGGRGSGAGGDRRRRRGRCPPAGHDRRPHHRPRARCPRREPGPQGHGLSPLYRPDARRSTRRNPRYREGRRHECRPPRRRHPRQYAATLTRQTPKLPRGTGREGGELRAAGTGL